jgi:hypothetical protein
MARMARVDCCKQSCAAALPTAGPVVAGKAATSTNGAVAGEVPNAAYGPPAVAGSAAMHHRQAPQLGGNHANIVACLVIKMVHIKEPPPRIGDATAPSTPAVGCSYRGGARFASAGSN